MAEEIKQGRENAADVAARKAAWAARDKDLANTPLEMVDVERILIEQFGKAVVDAAKRNRNG